MDNYITIWRLTYSHAWGAQWIPVRDSMPENVEAWIAELRKGDAKDAIYVASHKRPKLKEGDRDKARFAATF